MSKCNQNKTPAKSGPREEADNLERVTLISGCLPHMQDCDESPCLALGAIRFTDSNRYQIGKNVMLKLLGKSIRRTRPDDS